MNQQFAACSGSPHDDESFHQLCMNHRLICYVIVDIVSPNAELSLLYNSKLVLYILGVHDMQQASHKAESSNYKHAVNDM